MTQTTNLFTENWNMQIFQDRTKNDGAKFCESPVQELAPCFLYIFKI